MNRKLLAAIGGAGLFVAFGVYVGAQLQRHAQTCDSSLRHCPVPLARLEPFQGAWCNAETAARMGAVRLTFSREGERFRLTTLALAPGERPRVSDARFVLENGIILLFEADPATGAERGASTMLAVSGDRMETRVLSTRVPWIRCERLAENGVPAEVRALFAAGS